MGASCSFGCEEKVNVPTQSVIEKIGKSSLRFVPYNGLADGSVVGHRTLIK
jgi:hypothetical protein